MLAMLSDDGQYFPKHVMAKLLLISIKQGTLDELVLFIYVLRGVTAQDASHKYSAFPSEFLAKRNTHFSSVPRVLLAPPFSSSLIFSSSEYLARLKNYAGPRYAVF
jgi:hypothetical protein